MSYTTGRLWNFITQPQAAIVSQNMYKNDKYVESDLINSYAWDTAIVYIQAMGNTNYANANCDTNGNTTLKNTGETGDKVCNIFDMSGNTGEWTTEYSTYELDDRAYPYIRRGGYYVYWPYFTSTRAIVNESGNLANFSFRMLVYVK